VVNLVRVVNQMNDDFNLESEPWWGGNDDLCQG
jgi:hypothetical protein